MKKASILIFTTAVLLAAGSSAFPYSGGGTGEPNDPYRIVTAEDLNDIGNHTEDFNKCFVMVNDINLADYTGTQFNIIGSYINSFTGVFDGNSHSIANFTYETSSGADIGLFGYVDGLIENLTLVDPNLQLGSAATVGTLIGYLFSGTLKNCAVVNGNISGLDGVGGLVGGVCVGTVDNCFAKANVSGEYIVGGLIGSMEADASNSFSSGSVSGSDYVGGLLGQCFWGPITNCYSSCSVTGDSGVGGLIGNIEEAHIFNCFASGGVSGTSDVGGLIGYGEVGPPGGTEVVASFWDIETTEQLTSYGDYGAGKTTTEMKQQSTFADAGWDFVEIWDIGENQTYPFLRVYPAGDLNHDGLVDWRDFGILAGRWLEETR